MLNLPGKYFKKTYGNLDIVEEKEDKLKETYGISIVNEDDFGEKNQDISELLESIRQGLVNTEKSIKEFKCKAEGKKDIDCEFVFDKNVGDFKFKNIISRFEDADYIRIQTDKVNIIDGELEI